MCVFVVCQKEEARSSSSLGSCDFEGSLLAKSYLIFGGDCEGYRNVAQPAKPSQKSCKCALGSLLDDLMCLKYVKFQLSHLPTLKLDSIYI